MNKQVKKKVEAQEKEVVNTSVTKKRRESHDSNAKKIYLNRALSHHAKDQLNLNLFNSSAKGRRRTSEKVDLIFIFV